MQEVEALRENPWSGWLRKQKLEGLFATRSGIKAKRFRQLGKADYAVQIDQTVRRYTGFPIWFAARILVEIRELIVFRIGGRPRQPHNVYS